MAKKLLEKVSDHLALIDRLAARRFADPVLADEAVVYALGKMQESEARLLESFSGRSLFSSYLGSVVRRLFEDFSRNKFGRLRPPAWIAKLGGWWLILYRLLCLERLSLNDALATMGNYQRAQSFDVEEAAARILSEITDCGKYRGDEQLTADGNVDQYGDKSSSGDGLDIKLANKERDILFAVIFQGFFGDDSPPERLKDSFADILKNSPSMTSKERLLLKLCFQDDLSVSQAARLLNMSVHQAHGRLRRLLQRLKQDFSKAGLAGELILLLQEDEK